MLKWYFLAAQQSMKMILKLLLLVQPCLTVSGTTRVSWFQKGKTNLDLLEQEIVSGTGISWAYANLHLTPDRQPRQHPTTQFFTGRILFLPPNQQRQSTNQWKRYKKTKLTLCLHPVRTRRNTSPMSHASVWSSTESYPLSDCKAMLISCPSNKLVS